MMMSCVLISNSIHSIIKAIDFFYFYDSFTFVHVFTLKLFIGIKMIYWVLIFLMLKETLHRNKKLNKYI